MAAKVKVGDTTARANVSADANGERQDSLSGAVAKMRAIIADLKQNFAERDSVIDALFALFLSGQNALLLGTPGTAKSALVEACSVAFGASYFRYLMTRFTTDAELFGPWSIAGLQAGRYTRAGTGYVQEAVTAFFDECFKANSAILNALLMLLNEKEYFDDGQRKRAPLRMAIGASNELPEGPELAALYDRFVARFWLEPIIGRAGRLAVMTGAASGKPSATVLSKQDASELIMAASVVPFGVGIEDKILEIEDQLRSDKGITMTDRRRKVIARSLPAFAFVNGDAEVNDDTLLFALPDMVWNEPKQRSDVYSIIAKIANPSAAKANEILDAVKELFNQLPPPSDRPDPAYTGKLIDTKEKIAAAAKDLLALDVARKNRHVKNAANEIGAMYHSITQQAIARAKLGNGFTTDQLHTALTQYRA